MSAYEDRSWTGRLRRRAVEALPPEKLVPDKQPFLRGLVSQPIR